MFTLDDLNTARQKAVNHKENNAVSAYDDAWIELNKFKITLDKEPLQKAAGHLIKSLTLNPEHAQSYFCLAFIFYALDSYEDAREYLEKGESYCDELPEGIQAFKYDFLLPCQPETLRKTEEQSINPPVSQVNRPSAAANYLKQSIPGYPLNPDHKINSIKKAGSGFFGSLGFKQNNSRKR